MEAIQLIQVSPAELTAMIVEGVKMILSTTKEEEVLLTPEEAWNYLTISQSTLNRWRKDKKITGYSIEGTAVVVYKKSELLKLLKPLK